MHVKKRFCPEKLKIFLKSKKVDDGWVKYAIIGYDKRGKECF